MSESAADSWVARYTAEYVYPEVAKLMYCSLVSADRHGEIRHAYNELFDSYHERRDQILDENTSSRERQRLVRESCVLVREFVYLFPVESEECILAVRNLIEMDHEYLQLPAWFVRAVRDGPQYMTDAAGALFYVACCELSLAASALNLTGLRIYRRSRWFE